MPVIITARCTLGLASAAVVICGAALLGGCGRSTNTSAPGVPPRPHGERKAAPREAIDKVSIDQLTLSSTITRRKDRNGLEFLHFKYTDNDGKVSTCVLPAAMAEGEHTLSEWLSRFNVYRAQKGLGRKQDDELAKFPFVSPKPPPPAPKQRVRPTETTQTGMSRDRKITIYSMAHQFVKSSMKAPRSAKFPWSADDHNVQHLGNGRYRVTSWVEGMNSFGAQLRVRYTAVIQDVGGEEWRLESLVMDE